MNAHGLALTLGACLTLWACAAPPPPAPAGAAAAPPPVETVAAGFRAETDGLVYAMVYDLRTAFDGPVRAVAEFQDPAGGPPLRAEQAVPAGERRIALESPLMHEIGNHRDYAVVLTVYRNGEPIATQRDRARFDVDEGMVPMFLRRGIRVR